MAGKGAVMACDFNTLDIPWHSQSLEKFKENPAGLVLGVFFAPTMALLPDGKYTSSNRSTEEVVTNYYHHFQKAGLLK